ncbi:hypothetical protein BN2364_3863 [Alloalcanivorax xenomutans]|nr:hypothetical protein BN2364_3863 [Alloalcanivorax xenomutans]
MIGHRIGQDPLDGSGGDLGVPTHAWGVGLQPGLIIHCMSPEKKPARAPWAACLWPRKIR